MYNERTLSARPGIAFDATRQALTSVVYFDEVAATGVAVSVGHGTHLIFSKAFTAASTSPQRRRSRQFRAYSWRSFSSSASASVLMSVEKMTTTFSQSASGASFKGHVQHLVEPINFGVFFGVTVGFQKFRREPLAHQSQRSRKVYNVSQFLRSPWAHLAFLEYGTTVKSGGINENFARHFRLSLVVAALVATYSSVLTYQQSADYRAQQRKEYRDVKSAYECAARQADDYLRQFVNEYGLIDLIKAGCTDEKMAASFDEMKEWRDGTSNWHEPDERGMPALFDGKGVLLWFIIAFIGVNLIGVLVVGIKFVSQWVIAGFRSNFPSASG